MAAIASKICPGCKIAKPATVDYFARAARERSGLQSRCKECVATRRKTERNYSRIRDGIPEKFCAGCERWLPVDQTHFNFRDGKSSAKCLACAKPHLQPITKDLVGMRFGRLTVLRFVEYRGTPTRHAHWDCICDCGEKRVVRSTSLLHQRIDMCSKCAKKGAATKGGEKRRLLGDLAAFRKLAGIYRMNAKRRKILFNLSDARLRQLFSEHCHFCGAPPSVETKSKAGFSTFTYNGIDRLINSVGYEEPNVVACCATCNYAKREMGVDAFLDWIERVHRHTSKCDS